MRKAAGVFFGALVSMMTFAAPTVTDIVAKQRYPWNGLVDITCKVSGIDKLVDNPKFVLFAVFPDSENVSKISKVWVMKDGIKSSNLAVETNGNYHLLWDAKAELGKMRYSNMVVRVIIKELEKIQLWEDGPYWATTNIGAEEPWEIGYYFWWGDTIGYEKIGDKWVASDGSNSDFSFSENVPTYDQKYSTLLSEGWITTDGVLASKHDAAQKHWGGEWRMPTSRELNSLINNCDWRWTVKNGVYGYIVRGKGYYSSASIFLPATFHNNSSSWWYSSHYWSSSAFLGYYPDTYDLSCLSIFYEYKDKHNIVQYPGYQGKSIRPVQGFSK